MRLKNIACTASLLLVSTLGIQAANTLTAWTFDNLSIGASGSPSPSTGFGAATALGMGNSFNNTNSVSNPDIQSLAGSSSGGPNSWRIRGNGSAPNGGDGWSTQAPIGTQGAKFTASSSGFYQTKLSFDVYATADAEANLQIQYTTEGTIWTTAKTITSGGAGLVSVNSDTNQLTVLGTYVKLAAGWNNQITVDFSGVSGADNNSAFAVRIVNASMGTNCYDTTGAVYNNTSGSWTLDNVVVGGVNIDTISEWTFDSYGAQNPVLHPVPEINFGNPSLATSIGFDLPGVIFSDGSHGCTNDPDTLSQVGSSTGSSGPICWRVRGQGPGNGWYSGEPIGTQGGEFDVSTANFSNVVINFDIYFTTQGEAKMCVLYTTNGWTNSFTANSLFYGVNPTFIQTNDPANVDYSANTVTGTYFYETTGQNFYNNLVVDLTGVPGVDNNPYFGIKIVNAATGGDCVAFNGGPYNNSSGNCRFDNVTFGGQFTGSLPPAVAYDPSATVDGPFTNTFSDVPAWRTGITAIYVNGLVLTNTAYNTNIAGQLIFTPSASSVLQVAGVDTIIIYSTGYNSVKVTQPVLAGAFKKLATTIQPLAPSASGGTLAVNPVLSLTDQYGNTTTNPYNSVVVTAIVGGSGGWTLGGSTVQPETNGVIAFTNLSATVNGSAAVSGAIITLTVTGYTNSANLTTTTNFNLSSFNIGAPPVAFTPGNLAVLQIDTLSNNTTFSMIEVRPSSASQTTPVNIVPVNATTNNALPLRQAPSGSTGRLCLSDDGTMLCFAAFVDGSAATADETFNLNRAAAGMNYTNLVTIGNTYTSLSLGGSQARAAAALDASTWFTDDKGGLYEGNGFVPAPNVDAYNNVVVKTFGGVPYAETQKTANGVIVPVVYSLGFDGGSGLYDQINPNNLGTDPVATDFYLISTNCGSTYDIMYICDQNSSSLGVIRKYSWVNGTDPITGGYGWAANGTFTNATGVDGLFAATNGNGGAYIYYTTGSGGTGGNSIFRLTDSAGWNTNITVVSSNLIYTAAKTVSLKGLTFVPQLVYTNIIPPPLPTPANNAKVSGTFIVTLTPDDPEWRANLTAITVGGTTLSPTAYTVAAGKITFNPANSALLQSTGTKNIAISATGYSTNNVAQVLGAGTAATINITTQPTAPAADGGALAHQPVVKVVDLYGNNVTNVTITASASQTTWTLGGSVVITNNTSAVGTYAGLTAFGTNAVTGATIGFTSGSATATSSPFNIPAPFNSLLGGAFVGNGKFVFSFTNFPSLSFSVRATNNIAAPASTWPVIGAAVESPAASGKYSFTNVPSASGNLFYILSQP